MCVCSQGNCSVEKPNNGSDGLPPYSVRSKCSTRATNPRAGEQAAGAAGTLAAARQRDAEHGARDRRAVGNQPPATATKTVRSTCRACARRSPPRQRRPGEWRHGTTATSSAFEPDALDADRFESLAEHGSRELAAGHPGEAVAALETALGHRRGPPLSDLAGEAFAQPEIARLEDLQMLAVERLLEAMLALGEHDAVVSRLGGLIREHPYRERLRALEMLALYRAERQAEALQAYTNARRRVVGDLGTSPADFASSSVRSCANPALALPPPETLELPPELTATRRSRDATRTSPGCESTGGGRVPGRSHDVITGRPGSDDAARRRAGPRRPARARRVLTRRAATERPGERARCHAADAAGAR